MKHTKFNKILLNLILVRLSLSVISPVDQELVPIWIEDLGKSKEQYIEIVKKINQERDNVPEIPKECRTMYGLVNSYIYDRDEFEDQNWGSIQEFHVNKDKKLGYFIHKSNYFTNDQTNQKELQYPERIQYTQQAYNITKYLEGYDRIYQTDYSLKNSDCFVDAEISSQTNEITKWILILQYQHLQDNLHFNSGHNSKHFFNINFIKNDINYRFYLYSKLYIQQEFISSKLNLVKQEISPYKISPNIDFNQLEKEPNNKSKINQEKNMFNLKFNNPLGYLNIDSKTTIYHDTLYKLFWIHPQLQMGIELSLKKAFAIYSLTLSLIAIEFYQYGKDTYYLESKTNLESKIDEKGGYFEFIKNVSIEDRKIYGQQHIQKLREIIIKELCKFNTQQQKTVLQNLKNFKPSQSETFYQNNCGTCFACVLASVLQMDDQKIINAKQILKGFYAINQNIIINQQRLQKRVNKKIV